MPAALRRQHNPHATSIPHTPAPASRRPSYPPSTHPPTHPSGAPPRCVGAPLPSPPSSTHNPRSAESIKVNQGTMRAGDTHQSSAFPQCGGAARRRGSTPAPCARGCRPRTPVGAATGQEGGGGGAVSQPTGGTSPPPPTVPTRPNACSARPMMHDDPFDMQCVHAEPARLLLQRCLKSQPLRRTSSRAATFRQPRRRRSTSTSRLSASTWPFFLLQAGRQAGGPCGGCM